MNKNLTSELVRVGGSVIVGIASYMSIKKYLNKVVDDAYAMGYRKGTLDLLTKTLEDELSRMEESNSKEESK